MRGHSEATDESLNEFMSLNEFASEGGLLSIDFLSACPLGRRCYPHAACATRGRDHGKEKRGAEETGSPCAQGKLRGLSRRTAAV